MKAGVLIYPTDRGVDPVTAARAVEERGFESVFVPEHTHIPARRQSEWPRGKVMPDSYARLMDPFVALSAIAATTTRLRLGTGVCLVTERDPITTAKAVASLDQLSNGRVLFGVGAGWNREEMANHGTDPARRMSVMAERVRAMRAIWTQREASFSGEHVRFDRIWSWPKPVQRPHPPVLVGGTGPGVLNRVLEFGDGWMPNRLEDLEEFARRVEELQARARDRGRDPLPVTVFGMPEDPRVRDRCAAIGVQRCVFRVPTDDLTAFLRHLDSLAAFSELAS